MYLLWYHKKSRPSISIYYSLVWCFECYYCYHRLNCVLLSHSFFRCNLFTNQNPVNMKGINHFILKIYYLVAKSLGITILNMVLHSYYSVMILMLFLWQFSILSLSYFITKNFTNQFNLVHYEECKLIYLLNFVYLLPTSLARPLFLFFLQFCNINTILIIWIGK
jgi:hypothetical protein